MLIEDNMIPSLGGIALKNIYPQQNNSKQNDLENILFRGVQLMNCLMDLKIYSSDGKRINPKESAAECKYFLRT